MQKMGKKLVALLMSLILIIGAVGFQVFAWDAPTGTGVIAGFEPEIVRIKDTTTEKAVTFKGKFDNTVYARLQNLALVLTISDPNATLDTAGTTYNPANGKISITGPAGLTDRVFTLKNITKTVTITPSQNPDTASNAIPIGGSAINKVSINDLLTFKPCTIIVQHPVTVTVGEGGAVSANTTDYTIEEGVVNTTYDSLGTATDVVTNDVIWADSGTNQQDKVKFDIEPEENYVLKDILVDGTSVGAGAVLTANQNGYYETASIAEATSVEFQFEKNVSFVTTTVTTYTAGVPAVSTDGGTLSYGGAVLEAQDIAEVNVTGNQIFTISPKEGYKIKKVTVDGVENAALAGKTDDRTVVLAVSNLKDDHTISVEFDKIVYTITTTVEPTGDGTITGPATVDYGEDAVYTFAPKDTTVEVKEVWVDGVKMADPDLTGYTFTDVTANHTLKVVFGSAIGEIIVDPESGLTMDGDKAVVVLRGKWAAETTFTKMLSSIKINGGLTPVNEDTVSLSLGSAAAFEFPADVKPVELDATTFGKINVLQSGIVEVTVTAKADTSKSVTFVFIVPGDYDRDGVVNGSDSTEMSRVEVELQDLDSRSYSKELADMDKSGDIGGTDCSTVEAIEVELEKIK